MNSIHHTDSKQQTFSEKSAAVESLQKLLKTDESQKAKQEESKGHHKKQAAPGPTKKAADTQYSSHSAPTDLELARDKVHLFESYGIADTAGDLESAYDAIDKAEEDHERYLIQKYNK